MLDSLLSLLFASSLHLEQPAHPELHSFDDSALLEIAHMPQKNPDAAAAPAMSARALLVLDLGSNSILHNQNHQEQRSVASLTKLMTAHVILEENNLSDIVTVSANAASTPGSTMRLQANEQISVAHLLYGLLLNSGNDAAVALAEFNAGSVPAFVDKMNARAQALGMSNTHYSNPTGLDSASAYSTAQDLGLLSAQILRDSTVRAIVQLSEKEITSQSGITHSLENTNELLGELGVKGLKTGRTEAAGECLITLAESPEGREVLSIVLGSQARFTDSRNLLQWTYDTYTW